MVVEAFGTGTLEAKVVVAASAKMVGKVVAVLVDQGDTVTAGQCLARLESKDYEDSVGVAQARLTQAEAELSKAEADLERTRALFRDRIVSQADLDAQATARSVGAATVETARAEVGFARARLTDTRIVSPIAGLVVTRNLEVGSTVVPGAPIFRVADTSLIWVQAMVDERETRGLTEGAHARVVLRSDPGTSLRGTLSRVAREADRVTEELEADVKVEQLPAHFALGQKADVFIETARSLKAMQVPKSALVRRGQQVGVYVIADGRAKWRALKLGLIGREAAEVLEGLTEGAVVVRDPLRGKTPLAEGQRIVARQDAEVE
jgi:HlyD family secretion protein